MAAHVAHLLRNRWGFHIAPEGFAKFRKGQLIDASPAIWNAYHLRQAHLIQTGF